MNENCMHSSLGAFIETLRKMRKITYRGTYFGSSYQYKNVYPYKRARCKTKRLLVADFLLFQGFGG